MVNALTMLQNKETTWEWLCKFEKLINIKSDNKNIIVCVHNGKSWNVKPILQAVDNHMLAF